MAQANEAAIISGRKNTKKGMLKDKYINSGRQENPCRFIRRRKIRKEEIGGYKYGFLVLLCFWQAAFKNSFAYKSIKNVCGVVAFIVLKMAH